LQSAGATLIDSVPIPGFETLAQNQWCAMFEQDLNQFLATLDPAPPAKDLQSIVESGQFAPYIEGRLRYFLKNGQVPDTANQTCLDPYQDPKRIAFRTAIEAAMDSLSLDALIYPSWNYPPAQIGDFDGYKGDNSQIIAPHTGQPAFTVPMGFVQNTLPAGLQFLGRMYAEPTLIKLTYAYEQATQHRLKGPKINLEALEK
ncbi:MAG: amidase, partial [Saprospiraceae bacterium]|nr:amidase [Saprospiraceae bacterium]